MERIRLQYIIWEPAGYSRIKYEITCECGCKTTAYTMVVRKKVSEKQVMVLIKEKHGI